MTEIVTRFHDAMRHMSADELADLYAEDGVHEFPFRMAGMVPRYNGREEVRAGYTASWGASPAVVEDIRNVVVHQSVDPEVLVVEHETAVTVNGRPYTVPGLLVLRVRDGKIVHTRDYMDATAVAGLRSGRTG
ncbi:nuclear transport factor 2 family protein [Nonomuraea sp. NPDC004354]